MKQFSRGHRRNMGQERRGCRFSLRMLLVLVTLIAVVLAWLGAQARQAAERRELRALLTSHGMHAYSVYEELERAGAEFRYGDAELDLQRTRLGHLLSDDAYDPIRVLDLTTRRFDRQADWDFSREVPIIRYQGLGRLEVGEVLAEMKRFACAKEVHLVIAAGSDLNDDTLTLLEQFPELKHVDVVRTDVTAAGLRKLAAHPHLVSLTAEPDIVSEETARYLFGELPGLQSIILPTLPADLTNHMRGPSGYQILRREEFVKPQ